MIGAVTVTYNDDYKLKEWVRHYKEYESAVFEYVIVDNGSKKSYLESVKENFPKAVIIEAGKNLGSAGAYNLGISHLLQNENITAIALIGNDIKIDGKSLLKLENFLEGHPAVGMAAPVLLQKNSMIISDDGCFIDRKEYALTVKNAGAVFPSDKLPKVNDCDTVTGGMNMARRDFYLKTGLQDEAMFMYSDEVDMGIRAKREGYRMAVLTRVPAWHQHINPAHKKIRHPYSAYLMARNKIYLAYKHGSSRQAFVLFTKYLGRDIPRYFYYAIKRNTEQRIWFSWHLKGAVSGFMKDMSPNKYSSM